MKKNIPTLEGTEGRRGRHRLPVAKGLWCAACLLMLCMTTACSDDTAEYDPYHHWRSRNEAWIAEVADSARQAIAASRAVYGDAWTEHCDWRMYKSLRRSPQYQSGLLSDSICVHILHRGNGTVSPSSTDSIDVCFRGAMMPTTDASGERLETVFAQTYYGAFDAATAAPQRSIVNAFTEGFETALQYMVAGDDWQVYIPYQLFYDDSSQGIIPAYSAASFRIYVSKVITN